MKITQAGWFRSKNRQEGGQQIGVFARLVRDPGLHSKGRLPMIATQET
jgi:hypothetical protein